ncbi:type II secretion system F family protein [Halobacterium sp. KA-6]|uniref:type II secretion system F family protein n=1 Tax=Halobacterium sp. KA-6 TaxID=2896368 RepID=UPI001E5AEB4B|nr:type II secretion system F family protein [Halobacterium sp. KA-6]MCD2202525.1 type II secretion system F family protein [Halobacterium sp. KA-6]
MASPLVFAPLVAVLGVLFALAAAPVARPIDRFVSRVSLAAFGGFARRRREANPEQVAALQGAHVAQTYRVYAARTFFYATVGALAGSILGVYLVASVLVFLGSTPASLQSRFPAAVQGLFVDGVGGFAVAELFVLFLASGATLGVLVAYTAYQLRWSMPSYRAGERERRIDVSMERTVAFLYALSRSGMALPEVLRILARNRDVYGESAEEMAIAVKDVDMYGADILRALGRLGQRTPSEELSEFAENLTSVLQSGRDLPGFLKRQYDYYAEEAEAQQEQFLELLATLAEAYVTLLVAGPLFLITILVVVGLTLQDTLTFLQFTAYLLIPMATLGFVVYLDSITETATGGTVTGEEESEAATRFQSIPRRSTARTDGGQTAGTATGTELNRQRLDVYETLRPILYRLRNPLSVVRESPSVLLYATTPLAALYLVVRWWPLASAGVTDLTAYDDPLVHAALFVLGTFTVAYELHRRRVKAVEAGVPDFLDRFASTNEAGMPVVQSLGRVVGSDLGALTTELERTWADVQWGARVEHAFGRFRDRTDTPAISRVVTLTTNAMHASGDLGPVLRIAANEAKATRRLERDRRSELLTYLVVIYISFFVFLAIIVALDVIFIPNIPVVDATASPDQLPGGGGSGAFARTAQLTQATKDAYSLVFFHTGLVQAVCSGLVAGQMGQGSVKAGAKHATVMLALAYGTFVLLG